MEFDVLSKYKTSRMRDIILNFSFGYTICLSLGFGIQRNYYYSKFNITKYTRLIDIKWFKTWYKHCVYMMRYAYTYRHPHQEYMHACILCMRTKQRKTASKRTWKLYLKEEPRTKSRQAEAMACSVLRFFFFYYYTLLPPLSPSASLSVPISFFGIECVRKTQFIFTLSCDGLSDDDDDVEEPNKRKNKVSMWNDGKSHRNRTPKLALKWILNAELHIHTHADTHTHTVWYGMARYFPTEDFVRVVVCYFRFRSWIKYK